MTRYVDEGDIGRPGEGKWERETITRFNALFKYFPDALIFASVDRIIMDVNPAFESMFGYGADEVIGQRADLIYRNPDEFEKQGRARFNSHVEPDWRPYEVEYLRKNGETFPGMTIASLMRNEKGEAGGFVGIVRDVSQVKVAQIALLNESTERERFNSNLKTLHSLSMTQFDSEEEMLNAFIAAGCEMFGLPVGAVTEVGEDACFRVRAVASRTGTNLAPGLVFEESEVRFSSEVIRGSRTLALNDTTQIENPPRHAAGAYLGTPIRWGGSIAGVLAFFSDRPRAPSFGETDREMIELMAQTIGRAFDARLAAQLIEQQNLMLLSASRMATLGEMAAGIAHEINNPLAILHGRAEQIMDLWKQGAAQSDKVRDSVERILDTTMRIAQTVKALRTFARDATEDDPIMTPVSRIIGDVMDLCEERLKNSGVELRVSGATDSVQVPCRETQIAQVLMNLVSNSAHAIAELEEKWIEIHCDDRHENHVRLVVTDSGRGIPDDIVQRMMEPFFTTKAVGEGTGLGLSISKGIAESHGGALQYDSGGPYTRFVVILPRKNVKLTKLIQ